MFHKEKTTSIYLSQVSGFKWLRLIISVQFYRGFENVARRDSQVSGVQSGENATHLYQLVAATLHEVGWFSYVTFSSTNNVFLTLYKLNDLTLLWNHLTLLWNDLTFCGTIWLYCGWI